MECQYLVNMNGISVDGIRAASVKRVTIAPYVSSPAKRATDVAIAALLLVLALPLCILIALTILITSGRPVLFSQRRIGLYGRPFTMWKFRTLRAGEESDGYADESELHARYTPIGGFLRRRRLDELPQFVAVLTGVMSLVGPRPERVQVALHYGPKENRRLQCVPGMTGLWQVLAPRGQPIHRQMKYDLYYIRRGSLQLDLRVIVLTALVMLMPRRLDEKQ